MNRLRVCLSSLGVLLLGSSGLSLGGEPVSFVLTTKELGFPAIDTTITFTRVAEHTYRVRYSNPPPGAEYLMPGAPFRGDPRAVSNESILFGREPAAYAVAPRLQLVAEVEPPTRLRWTCRHRIPTAGTLEDELEDDPTAASGHKRPVTLDRHRLGTGTKWLSQNASANVA